MATSRLGAGDRDNFGGLPRDRRTPKCFSVGGDCVLSIRRDVESIEESAIDKSPRDSLGNDVPIKGDLLGVRFLGGRPRFRGVCGVPCGIGDIGGCSKLSLVVVVVVLAITVSFS